MSELKPIVTKRDWDVLYYRLNTLLEQEGEYSSEHGLCTYLNTSSDDPTAIRLIFEAYCWDKGLDPFYPVLGGRDAYWKAVEGGLGNLWDTNTEYGQARWSLVYDFYIWVVDKLEGFAAEG